MPRWILEADFDGPEADAHDFRTEMAVIAADKFGVVSVRMVEVTDRRRW